MRFQLDREGFLRPHETLPFRLPPRSIFERLRIIVEFQKRFESSSLISTRSDSICAPSPNKRVSME